MTDSMATTHFEVIGVLGVDKVGVRHYRREEIAQHLDYFESTVHHDTDCDDLISIVKFKIDSGKKHQIRAHASQLLKCPLLLDTKYGYSEDSFKSSNFKGLLKSYPDRFFE